MSARKKTVTVITGIGVVAAAAIVATAVMTAASAPPPTRVDELFAEAEACLDMGMRYDAQDLYSQIMNDYAESGIMAAAKLGLAETLQMMAPEAAVALYDEVAAANPGTDLEASARLARADVLSVTDVDVAVAEFEKLRDTYPGSEIAAWADFGLAKCLERKGRYEDARDAYHEVAERYSGTDVAAEALLKAACWMNHPGVWKDPVPVDEQLIAQLLEIPDIPASVGAQARLILCTPAMWDERWADVKELARQVIVQYPNRWEAIWAILETLQAWDEGQASLSILEETVESLASECAGSMAKEALNDLLWLLRDQPDFDALAPDPTDVPAHVYAVRASAVPKLWSRAQEGVAEEDLLRFDQMWSDSFIEYYPDFELSQKVHLWWAEAYPDLGNFEEAAKFSESYAALYPGSPKSPIALWLAGRCWTKAKQFEKAIVAYNEVLDRYPGNCMERVSEVRIANLYRSPFDDKARAIELYEQIVAAYPDTHEAYVAQMWLDSRWRNREAASE